MDRGMNHACMGNISNGTDSMLKNTILMMATNANERWMLVEHLAMLETVSWGKHSIFGMKCFDGDTDVSCLTFQLKLDINGFTSIQGAPRWKVQPLAW